MHIKTSDPDISSIVNRIKRGLIDLQPDFQRGEVWNPLKKQRLIDSILRGWHIPPIHLISSPSTDKIEVLDGQQRLVSIRDFIEGEFPINGTLEPKDNEIFALDGLYWDELPQHYRDHIELFTIRFLTISDYKIGEPGELFHRLNHPTSLTSAEQRNAFFGESRQQVKSIADYMTNQLGFDKSTIGFTNSRMAYDDVVAKLLVTIENGVLGKKITSSAITDKYRSENGFSKRCISLLKSALTTLSEALELSGATVRFNKASFHSWVLFVISLEKFNLPIKKLANFISDFELSRTNDELDFFAHPKFKATTEGVKQAVTVFIDRSTSRVADTSSVILRDVVLHGLFYIYSDTHFDDPQVRRLVEQFSHLVNRASVSDDELLALAKNFDWRAL
ncbi:TPA: DUF262 domain-containing protein [Vibrio vulnificus]|uniref:DUF262 domain-containing protein n=1 Tax=Vibrio vulnificus TaxID=672 RepID=UPI000DAD84E2|nr:DUF262 domain-containing protein [Vibrio vulnificus]MCU8349331.1 DUF262 domain-containing protein [Vibrio vulnificus]MDK2618637.1 DUF262 domain-containing protein [Vibrio vulnificus]QBH29779.1 hypothetical protein FORC77_4056 [Vibrio vulnificus]RAH17523.1 DUF262 domain-containing protein [Vibrio vulnificus]HAS6338443.1 DUF262 domain-containing protein [Vibrio vulnificus]